MVPAQPDLRPALDELEARLRAVGAPVAGAFRPGASPVVVRTMLEAEGVAPHRDLVAWWTWHDGVDTGAPPAGPGPGIYYSAESALFGPWHVLRLVEALGIRRWLRDTHRELGIEVAFPDTWVPVLTTDGAGELCANTSAAGPASLHIRDEGYFGSEPAQFASLSDFAGCIVEVFEAGLVVPGRWDPRVPSADLATLAADQRRLLIW